MKFVKYTRYTVDDFGITSEDLARALSDYFLRSGFEQQYLDFSEMDERSIEELHDAIQQALESGQLFDDQRLEEMMDEHSMASYKWLADQLDIPIIGPETVEGKMYSRADWIVGGAADILRGGVYDVGGLTPLMKIAHLAESFGMSMEVHGGGAANLTALGAMGMPGRFYERGLLHPFIDYDEVEPWLNAKTDFLDDEGFVHLPQVPGIGDDINFDYISENRV